MIDFLEDQDFRSWVLNPDNETVEKTRFWEQGMMSNNQARRAKYILQALKLHFEHNQLSHEEIEHRLEQEIDKYRYREKGSLTRNFHVIGLSRVAAALVVLVGLFFLVKWMNRPFDVYTTDYGEQLTIQLPDESIIQLNSNSMLTWGRGWENGGERMVNLEGEAFFQVEHLDGLPFLVNTDDITVHVTGTQFNVNSRRQKTMVYLDQGKVNVAVKERPEHKYEMVPGEELIYVASTDQVEQKIVEAPEEISSWKEGLLIFRDEPLRNVLKSVSDIYGKEFVTKDSVLLHRNITTTIPLTNWEVSLTAIQLAMRLKVNEENDTVRISGQ